MKEYQELLPALEDPGDFGKDFQLSPALFNMFVSQFNDQLGDPVPATKRFLRARKLYQDVKKNANKESAVFYSIRDRYWVIEYYYDALYELAADINNAFSEYQKTHSVQKLTVTILAELLEKYKQKEEKISAVKLFKSYELILCESYMNKKYLDQLFDLCESQNKTIEEAFFDVSQKPIFDDIVYSNFYKFLDLPKAYEQGKIYNPRSKHNWGVNCAWLLALIKNNINVDIISGVIPAYQQRGNPPAGAGPFPSAFALEMSVLFMSGYTLSYNSVDYHLALNATPSGFPDKIDHINGVEGQGIIPARQMQLDIYEEVMEVLVLGKDLNDWIPPTVLKNMDSNRLKKIIHQTNAYDAIIVYNPKLSEEDLMMLLDRTKESVMLELIRNHPNVTEKINKTVLEKLEQGLKESHSLIFRQNSSGQAPSVEDSPSKKENKP